MNTTRLAQGVPIAALTQQLTLYLDASMTGWGGHMGTLHSAGLWSQEEQLWHINILELEVVCRVFQQFQKEASGRVIRLFTDNTTVACYVNKGEGGRTRRPSPCGQRTSYSGAIQRASC